MTSVLIIAAIEIAANAAAQAVRFGLSFSIGLAAGVVALLYLRPARPVERALSDLFATLLIVAILIINIEYVLGGVAEPYGIVAYILGVCVPPLAARQIKKLLKRKKEKKRKK